MVISPLKFTDSRHRKNNNSDDNYSTDAANSSKYSKIEMDVIAILLPQLQAKQNDNNNGNNYDNDNYNDNDHKSNNYSDNKKHKKNSNNSSNKNNIFIIIPDWRGYHKRIFGENRKKLKTINHALIYESPLPHHTLDYLRAERGIIQSLSNLNISTHPSDGSNPNPNPSDSSNSQWVFRLGKSCLTTAPSSCVAVVGSEPVIQVGIRVRCRCPLTV
jgi:hypothetical protein